MGVSTSGFCTDPQALASVQLGVRLKTLQPWPLPYICPALATLISPYSLIYLTNRVAPTRKAPALPWGLQVEGPSLAIGLALSICRRGIRLGAALQPAHGDRGEGLRAVVMLRSCSHGSKLAPGDGVGAERPPKGIHTLVPGTSAPSLCGQTLQRRLSEGC